MHILQLAPSASGTVPVLARTTVIIPTVPFQWATYQNNGTNEMRIGDSSTDSTHGIVLFAGGALTFGPAQHEGQNLNEWFVYIVSGDICDIIYQE
jgi:hypothetical protein